MVIRQTLARLCREQQVKACEVISRGRSKRSLDGTIFFLDCKPFVAEEPDLLVRLHVLDENALKEPAW